MARVKDQEAGITNVSAATAQAWAASPLASCTPAVRANLLGDAREMTLSPGATFYRDSLHAETEKLVLVVSGLLRAFRRSRDGRQVTLRYAGPTELIGLPAVLGAGAGAEGQALLESRVLVLNAARFRAVARKEPELAWAVAEDLAGMVRHLTNALSAHLFLPVRSRVARHLLDVARSEDDRLVVHSSHQDMADAIGSVREVVSRTLRELSDEGCITRAGGLIVIDDLNALHATSLGVV